MARVSSRGEEEESKSAEDEGITVAELAVCKIVTSESFDSFGAAVAVPEQESEEEVSEEEVSRATIVPVMHVERRRAQVFSRGEEE
jgi:hypothetical protein